MTETPRPDAVCSCGYFARYWPGAGGYVCTKCGNCIQAQFTIPPRSAPPLTGTPNE